MKRSWLTYSAIGGLALVLVALGLLQYRWLSQISQTDGEKELSRVKGQTDRFAEDFNREIQGAYFNFQTEVADWSARNWSSFNERYDYWRSNTGYPALVKSFEFFESVDGAPVIRYDLASRAFHAVPDDDRIITIRAKLSSDAHVQPVDTATFTLFVPIHEEAKKVDGLALNSDHVARRIRPSPKYGHLVITLDREVLMTGLVADLGRKYFGEGDYLVTVKDPTGAAALGGPSLDGAPDATAPLFELSPNNILFFQNRELLKSFPPGTRERSVVINPRIESRTMSRLPTNGQASSTVKIELKNGESAPRTSVFTATIAGEPHEPLTLAVQHVSGSLDAFTASTLRRNLGFGFGLLTLLILAISAIIVSSMRARSLAQRQIDFVSSVSHEFRTPLAVIYSAGENLADGVAVEREQVSRYGDLIKGEGRKLSAMVEQILEFAGANSGKRQYKFAPTRLSAVVEAAIDECQPLLEQKSFEVERSVPEDLPPLILDADAISTAIQNLINNSIKYSNGSGWIGITASNGGGAVRLSVEDKGLGIDSRDMVRIFEPFYRARSVVDAQIHGNGLGLSLVKDIASAHGGKVTVMSEKGAGSTFTLEFPIRK